MDARTAADFVKQVLVDLNRRDYIRASRHFAEDVTLTGAEFAVLNGRDAVIEHFRQSDAALADSSLDVLDVLLGDAEAGSIRIGVELVLTGTQTGAFVLGAAGPTVAPTGRRVAIPVFWAMTVKDGKIERVSHYWDMFRVLAGLQSAAETSGPKGAPGANGPV
jgi:ketosteroid isomerase-like protein